jgi:DNA repair exonuclease SbcCD nuclease subunit
VVALHGNHERRTHGLTNPVEALEAAGQLVHLHASTLVFDTPDGKLAIHGLSNVPDKYLLSTLKSWNPKPVEGAFNILVLHQSIGNFVYSTEERPPLDISDLPPGFDLYVCGHVHCRAETLVFGRPLLIPGSTERTQLLLQEAQNPKGFYMVETGDGAKHKFIELLSPRDFLYEELKFKEAAISELHSAVKAKVEELLKRHRKNQQKVPIVKIRLVGTLSKGATKSDFDEYTIIEEYKDRAIVNIRKEALVSPELEDKLQLLREFREKHLSIDEQAMTLLEECLREADHVRMLDVRELYGLLVEKRDEEAFKRILEMVKNLAKAELGGEG